MVVRRDTTKVAGRSLRSGCGYGAGCSARLHGTGRFIIVRARQGRHTEDRLNEKGGGDIACAVPRDITELEQKLQKPDNDAGDDSKKKQQAERAHRSCTWICMGCSFSLPLLADMQIAFCRNEEVQHCMHTDQNSDTAALGSWQRGCLAVTALPLTD